MPLLGGLYSVYLLFSLLPGGMAFLGSTFGQTDFIAVGTFIYLTK